MLNQLCMALADLAVLMDQWNRTRIIQDLGKFNLNFFGYRSILVSSAATYFNGSNGDPAGDGLALLAMCTLLPDEVTSKYLRVPQQKKDAAEIELRQNIDSVCRMCAVCGSLVCCA